MIKNLHTLSIDQKLQIIEDLWDSIVDEQDALSLSAAQKTELDRRLAFYASTGDKGRDAFDAIEDIRKRL